jgi:TRAP-type mannitol/chloroaromatic compound transport system substrate-binding protein
LRPGSGLGLGFGAFLASFLPLSLLPMGPSVPQVGGWGKAKRLNATEDSLLKEAKMRLRGLWRLGEGDGILLVFRHQLPVGAGLRF